MNTVSLLEAGGALEGRSAAKDPLQVPQTRFVGWGSFAVLRPSTHTATPGATAVQDDRWCQTPVACYARVSQRDAQ
jgi:hypothetical protein